MKAAELAGLPDLHDKSVGDLIRCFNKEGLTLLQQRLQSGRAIPFKKEMRSEMVEAALCLPKAHGRPSRRWSLANVQ